MSHKIGEMDVIIDETRAKDIARVVSRVRRWKTIEGWGHRIAVVFFFRAEDGIPDLVRSRGLGDVYKRPP